MVESLARSLAVRHLLLVLDNCEHLLEEVAGLVGVLLARCPELVVLATSREGLAVRGERIVAVPSLQRDEAVALFTLRAASAGAELGERDEPDVMEIVDRLDGLPLAIELAAARARGLSIREIADRLDDRFRLLRGAGRGRLERHQTLWNTVAWSYELLSRDRTGSVRSALGLRRWVHPGRGPRSVRPRYRAVRRGGCGHVDGRAVARRVGPNEIRDPLPVVGDAASVR